MEFEIKSCPQCKKNNLPCTNIPSYDKTLSYDDFFNNHMHPNRPCIIKNVTQDWKAHSKWLINGHKPNLNYLKTQYGTCTVTLYNCNQRYFNSQQTETSTLTKFLDETWNPIHDSAPKYLKDWHLKNTFKDDNFYQVPIHFASDWLNEFLTATSADDYRFVYMGRAGTWTPFHGDVFNSFSWSANLCGRKRWLLFPPGEEESLKDSLGNLPYDIGAQVYRDRVHFQVIQNRGEAIFIPSGWYHQVWNLEDTISINHNWVNGCNIGRMWRALAHNLDQVKREIEDCKEMDGFLHHCQLMLAASFGMDFHKFYQFLRFVAEQRMQFLQHHTQGILFHGHLLGVNQAKFDLKALVEVLEQLLQHPDWQQISSQPELQQLLNQITHCAQENDLLKLNP